MKKILLISDTHGYLDEKILKPISAPIESSPLTTSVEPKPMITIEQTKIIKLLYDIL